MQGSCWNEQSRIAQAQDAINQFHAQNNLGTAKVNKSNELSSKQFNADTANQAKQFNYQNRQNTLNSNTDLRNSAQMQNSIMKPQQQFENSFNKANAKVGAYGAGQQYWQQNAAQKAAKDAQILGGAAGLGAAAIMASDERVKKDIKPINEAEVDEFLQAVNPKRFKYKESEQPKLGMILQDVADTKLGKEIISEDEDGIMHYDTQSLDGIMLAALSQLAKENK